LLIFSFEKMDDEDEDVQKSEDEEEEGDWDLDVTHYSREELAEALGVAPNAGKREVWAAAAALVSTAPTPAVAQFFEAAKDRLLSKEVEEKGPVGKGPVGKAPKLPKTHQGRLLLNLDSAYRARKAVNNLDSDNFSCDIPDTVPGVRALTLISVEIPNTWYTFCSPKGTNAFVLQCLPNEDGGSNEPRTVECTIREGNYSNLSLLDAVVAAMNAPFGSATPFQLKQDPFDGRCTITLAANNGAVDSVKITWFDPAYRYPALLNARLNNSLGWHLGFRAASNFLRAGEAVVSVGVMTAAGTSYVVMQLNDHTSGRFANSVVQIGATNDHLSVPDYAGQKADPTDRSPSLPQGRRQLTAKQVYTINAIRNQLSTRSSQKESGTVSTDVFAKVPLKQSGNWNNYDMATKTVTLNEDGPGSVNIEMGGTLQKNRRVFPGLVTISRLSVALYDDNFNLLGLNGHDWSCTIEIEVEDEADRTE